MESTEERNEVNQEQPFPPLVIRDDLVKTACDFLAIPKVAGSSVERKKNFLRSKGLNEDEIELAFIKSSGSPVDYVGFNEIYSNQSRLISPSSWSSTITRFSFSTVVLSGICYGGYILFKKYLQPKILRYFSDRLDTIENKLDTMIESVKKLESETSTDKLQQTIQSHLMNTSRPNTAEIHAINELKIEISSVKALILSKRSLDLKSPTSATIPAWQMDENLTNGNSSEQLTLITPDEDSDTSTTINGGKPLPGQLTLIQT